MAALVPIAFPEKPRQAIASFDFTDIADATGTVIFLGLKTIADTTANHHLTQDSLFSEDINAVAKSTGTALNTWEMEHDIDFDLSIFNLPQTIRGSAKVSVTMQMIVRAGNTGRSYFIAKLRKWDGSSETEIANTQSSTFEDVPGGSDSTNYKTVAMNITVPRTHFNKGDTLRMTIEHWAFNSEILFYADPKGRTAGSADTTVMEAHIPFDIDI